MLIGSVVWRARIDWYLVEFIVRFDWSDAFCRWLIFFLFNIADDKSLTQFVIHYKSRCPNNAVWNTMYYKLRCNSTQFVMYYKLRNYYTSHTEALGTQWYSVEEWVSFFCVHGKWTSVGHVTNPVNREAVLGRFVSASPKFISHECRKIRHLFLIFTTSPNTKPFSKSPREFSLE